MQLHIGHRQFFVAYIADSHFRTVSDLPADLPTEVVIVIMLIIGLEDLQ